ncbi:cytochrome c oxidase subunit 4 [Nocardia sp. NPDC004151]
MLAGAGIIAALGLAFFQFWLIGIGVVCVLAAVAGLVFGYRLGPEKH